MCIKFKQNRVINDIVLMLNRKKITCSETADAVSSICFSWDILTPKTLFYKYIYVAPKAKQTLTDFHVNTQKLWINYRLYEYKFLHDAGYFLYVENFRLFPIICAVYTIANMLHVPQISLYWWCNWNNISVIDSTRVTVYCMYMYVTYSVSVVSEAVDERGAGVHEKKIFTDKNFY